MYNRCVTGRRTRDENHVVRFRESAENRSRAWNTQPIRSSLMSLQGVQALAPLGPGRRYGKKKSSLRVYVSQAISHTQTETSTFSRIKCERYILMKKKRFIRSSSRVNQCYDYGNTIFSVFGAVTRIWDMSMVLLWFWDSSRNYRGSYCGFGGWEMHLYCTLMHACRDSQPREE